MKWWNPFWMMNWFVDRFSERAIEEIIEMQPLDGIVEIDLAKVKLNGQNQQFLKGELTIPFTMDFVERQLHKHVKRRRLQ